jgi:hypothetical protein
MTAFRRRDKTLRRRTARTDRTENHLHRTEPIDTTANRHRTMAQIDKMANHRCHMTNRRDRQNLAGRKTAQSSGRTVERWSEELHHNAVNCCLRLDRWAKHREIQAKRSIHDS